MSLFIRRGESGAEHGPFPIQTPILRRLCAANNLCPECGGELDTGWECNDCGYDARDEAYPPERRERDKRLARLVVDPPQEPER